MFLAEKMLNYRFSSTHKFLIFDELTFSNYEAPKVKWSAQQLFAVVLALWWTPATFVLTFFAPFTNTSNAYFAIWAAMITTVLMLAVSAVTHAHAHTQNTPLVFRR